MIKKKVSMEGTGKGGGLVLKCESNGGRNGNEPERCWWGGWGYIGSVEGWNGRD